MQRDRVPRVTDADFDVGGRHYGVFAHDWRREPPLEWIERKGVVAFQEFHAQATVSHPSCPTYYLVERIRQTLSRVGADSQIGLDLWRIFREAGLTDPWLLEMARVEASPAAATFEQVVHITRTLLPVMERTGVATAVAIDVDSLHDRLCAEAVECGRWSMFPPLIAAWSRGTDA